MSDTNISDENATTDGLKSEGGVWGVGDPKDEAALAEETTAGDTDGGQDAADGGQDAAFLDVDEADVETSDSDDSGHDQQETGDREGDVEPGTDDEDTTVSRLTDALDSDALASNGSAGADATGSDH